MICGLPCSGKTTLARVLERELPALRLSPDEWIIRLFGPDLAGAELDAVRDPVESALWDLAAHVLVLGVDVILEFGFWIRAEREEFRRKAAVLGARSKLYFTDAPEEELLHRLARRNTERPAGTFRIEEAQLRMWMRTFEPPAEDELLTREAPRRAQEQ